MLKSTLVLGFFLSISCFSNAQSLNVQLASEYIHVLPNIFNSALTPVVDKLGRPYVYVASNELGLRIYGTDPGLNLITTVDTNQIFMSASSLTQNDTLLYIALGSLFPGSTDPTGMVIVNVADPLNPIVLDEWINTQGNGTGVVRVQGDYAYVGGMSEGLIILNVSDPNNILFVSQFIPDITFPHITNDPLKVNARGMTIVGSLVYLCYDAGGIRVIDCSDVSAPVQIGEFSNPITISPPPWSWNLARAYNNIVIEDTTAYVAADYCGLEVWSVADPANAVLLSHWNPVGCPTGAWLFAPVHANELIAQFECDVLFVSTGSSDMMVLDISDPFSLVAIDSFGTETDALGTWGIDVTNEYIYLTYLFVPLSVPFAGTVPGIKQLSYDRCSAKIAEIKDELLVELYPNPAGESVTLKVDASSFYYEIVSITGRVYSQGNGVNKINIGLDALPRGMYIVRVTSEGATRQLKLVHQE